MHLKFSEVFWGFASDCCFQYVLKFSIDWWRFLRFWFRRLLPFYFRFLRLVGDSGRYNTILKVAQCPRLLGTNQWPRTNPWQFWFGTCPSHYQAARSLSCHKPRASMTKKGPFFWSSQRKKKQARKNWPSQFKILVAAVAGQISFCLK